jgi:PiT family inorganic phosphate transporter
MTTVMLIWIAVLALAWANGANDNFKGVATLYGSRTLAYRNALLLATLATAAGSLASIELAQGLVKSFSGSGLVPDAIVRTPAFLLATGGGAGLTILLATRLGMPTSTTHALTGALLGAGLVNDVATVGWSVLQQKFLLPLLLSRRGLGLGAETYVCAGELRGAPAAAVAGGAVACAAAGAPAISLETRASCAERYTGRVAGVRAQGLVDGLHMLSGAGVCFARALNDTPKIAALALALGAAGVDWKLGLVAAVMALGGIVQSRRVARTMSERITELNTGQGLTANLVTAGLVTAASTVGLPVSTTHVSCGAIFGIGAVRRSGRWRTIAQILTTWLTTLPTGLVLGAAIYWVAR